MRDDTTRHDTTRHDAGHSSHFAALLCCKPSITHSYACWWCVRCWRGTEISRVGLSSAGVSSARCSSLGSTVAHTARRWRACAARRGCCATPSSTPRSEVRCRAVLLAGLVLWWLTAYLTRIFEPVTVRVCAYAGIAPWLTAVLASATPMSAMDLIRAGGLSAAGGASAGVDHGARAALGAGVLDKLLSIAMAALDPERPPLVSAAAARLLLVLSADVRPKGLAQTPQYTALIQHCSSGPEESLGAQLAASQPHGLSPFLLVCAVSNALLLTRSSGGEKRSAEELAAGAA